MNNACHRIYAVNTSAIVELSLLMWRGKADCCNPWRAVSVCSGVHRLLVLDAASGTQTHVKEKSKLSALPSLQDSGALQFAGR